MGGGGKWGSSELSPLGSETEITLVFFLKIQLVSHHHTKQHILVEVLEPNNRGDISLFIYHQVNSEELAAAFPTG